jgi:hypothetical protein
MKMRKIILHPFLIAVYPVMALYAFNMGQSRLADALRAFFFLPLLAGMVLVILKSVLKDWGRAGFVTSLGFLLFFSYGHLINRLSTTRFGPFLERFPWFMAVVYGVTFVVGVFWIACKMRSSEDLTQLINGMSIVLLIIPIYSILSFSYTNRAPSQTSFLAAGSELVQTIVPGVALPDIYYIIPDGYARQDVLEEIYGLDNNEFIEYLESKGFYVASGSHSNYDQTALSVASSLNYDYLDSYGALLGKDSQNREPLYTAIDHSRLRQSLEQAGYVFVDVNSGNPITQIKDATYYLTPSRSMVVNYFEREILAGSVIGKVVENDITEQYRTRLLNEFELGANLSWIPSPKFVFIHIVAPHPPFVFDAEGDPVTPPELVLRDGSRYPGSRENYLSGYKDQLLFINGRLEYMIDAILSHSTTIPVIILQGDHGPGAFLDWSSSDNSCIVERTAILNALLLPGIEPDSFYPGMTPVNTFRLVLNTYLGTEYPLLDDRTYMPSWDKPYDFIDVTQRDDTCSPRRN